MSRDALIADVVERILALEPGRPAAVAIDGPDAAGKTTFADALVAPLETRGAVVVRASIDDFQQPRARRYARGRYSAKGYYREGFDTDALIRLLLDPLASGASPALVRTRAFDLANDVPVSARPVPVPARGIVLVDGVFLQRPELVDYWDLVIYLDVPEEEALHRALARAGGDSESLRRLHESRYFGGHRIYRDEVDPVARADIVIDNSDVANPCVVRSHHP